MDETGEAPTASCTLPLQAARPARAPRPATGGDSDAAGQLVCLVGESVGRVYPLTRRPLVIGRAADADIRVLGDDVSRRHAQICWSEFGFAVEDLDSRNGVSVNGVLVRRQTLQIGDRIQIASSAVLVYAQPDELEQRAMRLQKLEMLGELAATLTHDFKNMPGVIAANAQYLQEVTAQRYPADDDVSDSLRDITSAADTAASLTGRLLDFVRRRDLVGAPSVAVPLRAVVDDALAIVRRAPPASTKIVVDVDEAVAVYGDPIELHQIVSNLCLNAVQAMPRGGALTLRAARLTLARPEALALHLEGEGDYVELRVVDTGVGMDHATLAHIFEPFFTTRPGSGTGLGLCSVFGLVRSRGGNVLVESAPGQGATFRLLLRQPPAKGQPESGTERRTRIPVDAVRAPGR